MEPIRIAGQGGEPVIACALGGDEVGAQAERWLRLGRDAGLGRAETADGVSIRFRDEPAVEQELRALVAVESACCAWARWDVARAGGELVLQVHAGPEGAAALRAMFSEAAAASENRDDALALRASEAAAATRNRDAAAAQPGEGSSPG